MIDMALRKEVRDWVSGAAFLDFGDLSERELAVAIAAIEHGRRAIYRAQSAVDDIQSARKGLDRATLEQHNRSALDYHFEHLDYALEKLRGLLK